MSGSGLGLNIPQSFFVRNHALPESSVRMGFQCLLPSWALHADLMRGSESSVGTGFQGILMFMYFPCIIFSQNQAYVMVFNAF